MRRLIALTFCILMVVATLAPASVLAASNTAADSNTSNSAASQTASQSQASQAIQTSSKSDSAASQATQTSSKSNDQKVIRVGWFDSSFCYKDKYGRRCGTDYEYRSRISAYTGWEYEYVEDSWPNLYEMLTEGKIDLLCDVSYKPERDGVVLFPDLPMGKESYYIYVAAASGAGSDSGTSGDSDASGNSDAAGGSAASGNSDAAANAASGVLSAEDLSTFNGKRIGVNKGSIQEGFLKDWAKKNKISIKVVPVDVEESEAMEMVTKGKLDGYAAIYSLDSEDGTVPACRIGGSEYFYAVNKDRPDLLAELNVALAGIQDEDPYFIQTTSEERLHSARTSASVTPEQERWLKKHGPVRIGYQDDYLPFCQKDKETGELTGALKDYLAHAENSLKSTGIKFETTAYATTDEAIQAMKDGEIDCVFPVNLSTYDAEENGMRLTNPAMKTEMNTVVRSADSKEFTLEDTVTFAVAAGTPNVDTFVMAHYPESERKTYPDTEACCQAVADREADCVLISNYRLPDAEDAITRNKLFSVPTGESMPLAFAVKKADPDLYFIMNKTVVMTKSDEMDTSLASYMRSEQKVTFMDFLRENLIVVIAILLVVFAVIIFLLLQKMKAERKANEKQRLLEEAEKVVELKQTISSLLDNMPGMNYTKDAETRKYLACNQAFAEYAHKASPEEVIGLASGDLFDAEVARRFEKDDEIALTMDEPYIFFEDVPDADGRKRQIKTTKLKYTDAGGRLCVLGISLDVTADTVRIHRGDASTKEDYEKVRSTGIIYAHIAQALAKGYSDLYYINLDSEEFIEYRTDGSDGRLTEARRGWHFFEVVQEDAEQMVHPEDRVAVLRALDRRTLVAALDQDNSFMMTYRLMGDEGPTYVLMKVTRMQDDDRAIILGVTDVDEQVRERNDAERMKEEQAAYSRLSALAGDYLSIYVISPETGHYREFSAAAEYDVLARSKQGEDFFADAREQSRIVLYPEDRKRFLEMFTREKVMADVERHGIFTLSYRLILEGKPRYVQLKAVMLEEKDGPSLIIGINDIDSQVRQEEEYVRRLAQARIEANVDALTGVKNRHAYLMAEERLNIQIEERTAPEFAIVILDVNDLKKVNDIEGHKAGDQYLRDACRIICKTFDHSPVFRVGGDEFAVIAQGEDYIHMDELIQRMEDHNMDAIRNGGIVIACGMARYEGEANIAIVFERADENMYENKSDLKERRG